ISAVRPVMAIWTATARPRHPPTTAMTLISAYQKTPSPRRLMAPKKMPMARRAPQRLAATHMRRSRLALRGDGGATFMDALLGEGLHDRFEFGDDRFGRETGDRRASGGPYGGTYGVVGRQGGGTFDQAAFIAGGDANAVLPVANDFARGGFGVGDHGDARAQRFEHHVAEGFGEAGEDEEIRARVVGGQIVAAAGAGEDDVGIGGFERGAARAVTDDDAARPGHAAEQGAVRLDHHVQVLFRGDAAHAEDHRRIGRRAPCLTQALVAAFRMEARRVDSAAKHAHVVHAEIVELTRQLAGWHEGGLRAAVEAGQVVPHQRSQRAETIVADIEIEAGMEPGGDRDAEPARRTDGAPAQGAFRGHVDGIRPFGAPAALDAKTGGQAEAQARVARHRGAFDGEYVHAGFGEGRGRRMDRTDQVDGVTAAQESAGKGLDGQGDTVDVRCIGLGDDADSHGGAPGGLVDLWSRRGVSRGLWGYDRQMTVAARWKGTGSAKIGRLSAR